MKIGYARVSTREQHLDMQLEALRAAGCEKIFSEKMTGRQQNRPELDACLNFLREGDTLVVYKLDRLGRSLKNILTLLEDFKNKGILFTSLQDSISTEGATGQLMANILGAFAQFERDLIYERTQEGRRIAKEKGVKFGRKTLRKTEQQSFLSDLSDQESLPLHTQYRHRSLRIDRSLTERVPYL